MTKRQSWMARGLTHATVLGFGVMGWGLGEARAATINVTTTSMSASPSGCGFREALQALNNQTATGGCAAGDGNSDVINLPAGTYTSTVTLSVARSVELRGAGVAQTLIRSNLASGDTFILVSPGPIEEYSRVVFQDLTLSRVSTQAAPQVTGVYATAFEAEHGLGVTLLRTRVTGHTWGGVYSDGAEIRIEDSTVDGNSSPWSGAGVAVNNTSGRVASTNIYHSTINGNTSQDCGGGVYHGAQGNSHLDLSTVSGNTAARGGGLCLQSASDYFQIDDSTIAFNTAINAGGGISSGGFGNYYVFNSIVARNRAHAIVDWDGYLTTLRNSLIGEEGVSILDDDGSNLFNVDPVLDSTLRSLGGPTKVHRLLSGSPAIDYFTLDPLPTDYVDQRYLPKCVNGDGAASSTECDIGAVERQP